MKKNNIVYIFVLMIGGFIVGVIHMFLYDGQKNEKELDKYFEKVEYFFCGKINSLSKLSGGERYLIELDIDSVFFIKNNISNNDNFVGLYSKSDKKIFFIAFCDENLCKNRNILPYVVVSSSKRTIEYIVEDNISRRGIDLFYGLCDELRKIETKEMIRF